MDRIRSQEMTDNDTKAALNYNAIFLLTGLILISLLFVTYNYFRSYNNPENTNGVVGERIREMFSMLEKEKGQIDDFAASDVRDTENDESVAGIDTQTNKVGAQTSITSEWKATDYSSGEITKGIYTVKNGDTLWEIAEAVYGNGNEWQKILAANKANIEFLPNGTQALIITGQTLSIP